MSDFVPQRPVVRPPRPQAPVQAMPVAQTAPQPHHAQITSAPAMPKMAPLAPKPSAQAHPEQRPQQIPPRPQAVHSLFTPPVLPDDPQDDAIEDTSTDTDGKPAKEPSLSGHAGLIGVAIFIILGGLLASPLLPGTILDNFPGNSQSMTEGVGSLACIKQPDKTTISKNYDTKLGSPIVYSYTLTTTETGSCDGGKVQSAITGKSTQFNPLGLCINLILSLVVALAVSSIWRKIYRKKHQHKR